ncbi:MAG TPA: hypothetical protein VE338_22155 [Ktedonobacterales bacterium]|jgi:hypothetical protein|nr:hypothetical protein [Ktedonobacterales bacterium]
MKKSRDVGETLLSGMPKVISAGEDFTMQAIRRYSAMFILLAMLTVSLSGCIHLDRSVTLNGDGSGSYTLTIGFSEQLVSLASDQISANMDSFSAKVKNAGGSYRHYDDTGYSYWAYTRPFTSVSALNQLLQETPQAGNTSGSAGGVNTPSLAQDTLSFSEQTGILSNSFHAVGHMSMNFPQDTTNTGGIDVTQYLKDMRESFAVTMPGWITSHRGGAVSGNTVTYTVHYGEETDVDVVGGGYNTALLLPGGIGVVVVLALIVLGVVFWRRRGRRTATQEMIPAYVAASPDAPTVPAMDTPPDGAVQS